MKKQTLVATIGTLALAANVLLPGLAFSQQTDSQTGSADIGCPGVGAVIFTQVPDDFSFFLDGASQAIPVPTSLTSVYSDDAGGDLVDESPAAGNNRFLEVSDPRDFASGCANGGFTVTVVPEDQADSDSCYFEDSTATGTDDSGGGCTTTIPLDGGTGSNGGLRVVTSVNGLTCDGGSVGGVCFRAGAQCENGGSAGACSAGNGHTASVDFGASQDYATYSAFSGVGSNTLGSGPNTPTAVTLMNFPTTDGMFGEAGLAAAYAGEVPAFQGTGTYQLNLLYTLTPA